MSDHVHNAREACFETNQYDCSTFVRAVAERLGVTIDGSANDIVTVIRTQSDWQAIPDGITAAARTAAGQWAIGSLRGDEQFEQSNHGHVVVVMAGPSPIVGIQTLIGAAATVTVSRMRQ